MMNESNKALLNCELLINKLSLPDTFCEIVTNTFIPLAKMIIAKKHDQSLLISINGAQGTGKSTMTLFIKEIIETISDYHVASLSLDDFYYTRSERQKLANEIHPLLGTRGVPGTHDIDLIENVFDALLNHKPCSAPLFDKAIDDRCKQTDWNQYQNKVDIILFEGWCNNSPVQTEEELSSPINELEETEDSQGIWRHHVNEKLKEYHKRIFNHTDLCIMLKAPGFEYIYDWRRLQEQKLKTKYTENSQHHILNDSELKRFIQHYERISRHTLQHLPDLANFILPVATDHSIERIIQNHG